MTIAPGCPSFRARARASSSSSMMLSAVTDQPATSFGRRCAIATSAADHQRPRRPCDHRPSRTSLGPRAKNRAAPSASFFQKAESDFAAPARRGAFPSGHTTSVIGGNSEVSGLREFFAV
jgi:hypothetical protein